MTADIGVEHFLVSAHIN